MKSWQQLEQFINATSERERLLILGALSAVILLGSIQFVLEPMQQHTIQLQKSIKDTQVQQAAIAEEMQLLASNDPSSPQSPLRLRLARAQAELDDVSAELAASGRRFLGDRELARWLAQLLREQGGTGLRITGLQSLPAVQVYPANGKQALKDSPALYRKGVELRFSGNYADTTRYFQRLAGSPWPLEWSSLDYKVTQYPRAEVRAVVNTYILGADLPEGIKSAASVQAPGSGEAFLDKLNRATDPAYALPAPGARP